MHGSSASKIGSDSKFLFLIYFYTWWSSFYPLYPPAEGIPLDSSLAPEALHISSIPDILILPSDLAHFVRVASLIPLTRFTEIQILIELTNQ